MRRTLVVIALLAAACRTAPAPDRATTAGTLPVALSATPVPAGSQLPTDVPVATAGVVASPGSGGSVPTPTPRPRRLASAQDPSGDAGLQTPEYADIVSVELVDLGSDVRVTVEFVAALPRRLGGEDEVMGVGFDLYRDADAPEGDYQLFADGGFDGWRAYLATPDGFVAFPGTFELDGVQLVLRVPWSSLGSMRGEAFRAFADWSGPGLAVPASGRDLVPDVGRRSFVR